MRYDLDRRRAKSMFISVLIGVSVLIVISSLNLFLTLRLLSNTNTSANPDVNSGSAVQGASDHQTECLGVEIFGDSAPGFISSGESNSN